MARSDSDQQALSPPVRVVARLLPYLRRVMPAMLIAYWGALFIATHVPLPKTGGRVNDKLLHLIAYALLAFLFAWVLSPRNRILASWCIVVLVCAVYGLIDELLQQSVPSRTADPWDFVADVIGAALGATLFLILQAAWRRVRSSRGAVEQQGTS